MASSRKVPSSLLALTYGALVAQLVRDCEGDVAKVNAKLDQIGESMGARLVDEVLSRAGVRRCGGSFREAVNVVCQAGFKHYWGSVPTQANWNAEGTQCLLVFAQETPLEELVDLPDHLQGLKYTQVLCGVLRGALQSVNIRTTCEIERDRLVSGGDGGTHIRVQLVEFAREMAGEDYQDE